MINFLHSRPLLKYGQFLARLNSVINVFISLYIICKLCNNIVIECHVYGRQIKINKIHVVLFKIHSTFFTGIFSLTFFKLPMFFYAFDRIANNQNDLYKMAT